MVPRWGVTANTPTVSVFLTIIIIFLRELLRYTRQLKCTGILVLKIYTLTIFFYEKKELFCWYLCLENIISLEKYHFIVYKNHTNFFYILL